MALHSCATPNCKEHASGRNIMCSKCWYLIPGDLKATVRAGTKKGAHSLRARPTREWLSAAARSASPAR